MNALTTIEIPPDQETAQLLRETGLPSLLMRAEQGLLAEAIEHAPATLMFKLPAIHHAMCDRLAPCSIDETKALLTKTLALLGTRMSEAAKTEFMITAYEEFLDMPATLVSEGLREARRTCTDERQIVPFVVNYVADYPAKWRAALDGVEAVLSFQKSGSRIALPHSDEAVS